MELTFIFYLLFNDFIIKNNFNLYIYIMILRLTVYVAPTPGTLLVWYNVDKMGRNYEVELFHN